MTITIGGNDMHFSDVLERCFRHECLADDFVLFPPDEDPQQRGTEEWLQDTADDLRVRLETLDRSIRQRTGPDTTILVMGYPYLFPDSDEEQTCLKLHQWLHEMDQLNHWSAYVAEQIEAAAAAAGVWCVDMREPWEDHEVCGDEGEWLGGPGLGAIIYPDEQGRLFHPTIEGQRAYALAATDFVEDQIADGAPLTSAGLPMNPTPSP